MHWEDEKLMVIIEGSGSVNLNLNLKVTWEEGKLMNLN